FYLSGSAQLLERVHSFLERRRSLAPVQKIKINHVDAEPLETALTSFWQFRTRRIMRINFRNHKNAFALSVDRFSDNLLRSAVAVHLRSVNQAHAKLDSQTQRCHFPGTRTLAFAHAPRALPEHRNALSVG